MRVEIYSDVVCPWCYIGERRFARALAAYPRAGQVEVVFRPFQLDPEASTTAMPLPQYLQRRFGRAMEVTLKQVTDAARGEGIEIAWDRALAVNTGQAHRLMRLAEMEYGAGVQRALAEALFDGHFSRGADVGDAEQLSRLAEAVGMDGARVRAYLASDEGAAELAAELRAAVGLGVRAVPTFVFDGRWVVQGAQSASVFLQALEEVDRHGERGEREAAACEGDSCAA